MEAAGSARWFERLLADCGHQLWIGDPARVRAAAPRKQKTDRRDADLLLQLLLEDRFPRLWWMWKLGRDYGPMVGSGSHVE